MPAVESGADVLLGETLVAEEPLRFERFEHATDRFPAGPARRELECELAARMLSSCEKPQRPRADVRSALDAGQASTAPSASSGVALRPGRSNPRNAVSMASAMSSCCLRNSRTLSRP